MLSLEVEGLYTANQVAQKLNINTMTLKRWYQWYENPNYNHPEELKLPPYIIVSRNRVMAWKPEDLSMLEEFQRLLHLKYRGIMRDYHQSVSYGNIGRERFIKRGQDPDFEKLKLYHKEVGGKMEGIIK